LLVWLALGKCTREATTCPEIQTEHRVVPPTDPKSLHTTLTSWSLEKLGAEQGCMAQSRRCEPGPKSMKLVQGRGNPHGLVLSGVRQVVETRALPPLLSLSHLLTQLLKAHPFPMGAITGWSHHCLLALPQPLPCLNPHLVDSALGRFQEWLGGGSGGTAPASSAVHLGPRK
jgi:hypothetical protein